MTKARGKIKGHLCLFTSYLTPLFFFEVIGKLKIEGKITIEVSVRGRNAITHFLFGC
jgi:hypothetical protein